MFGALPNAHCNRLHSLIDYPIFIANWVRRTSVSSQKCMVTQCMSAGIFPANTGWLQHSPGWLGFPTAPLTSVQNTRQTEILPSTPLLPPAQKCPFFIHCSYSVTGLSDCSQKPPKCSFSETALINLYISDNMLRHSVQFSSIYPHTDIK